MGFPGVYGVMFPVMVFKAALSIVLLKETACSVFNLLLGRGWHNPVSRVGGGPTDWVYSDELVSGSVFESRESLIQDIRARLNAVRFKEIASRFEEEEEHQCSVCLCDFEAEEEVFQLPQCSHIFHKECLGKWLGHGHTTCPLCRSTLASEELLEKRRSEGLVQIDADLASEFALWFSMYHPEAGRGHWWQAYLQGIPDVLSGVAISTVMVLLIFSSYLNRSSKPDEWAGPPDKVYKSPSSQAERLAVGACNRASRERFPGTAGARLFECSGYLRALHFRGKCGVGSEEDANVLSQFLHGKFDVGCGSRLLWEQRHTAHVPIYAVVFNFFVH
ncbi:hypothetical protein R1sor_015802 [Riccia sorocarpa]|uniref:RING-type domain-containing protein n=1 Tax=Riccia sorocarpa TaxID=122646 RepID=A0ABD3HD81_9MARC